MRRRPTPPEVFRTPHEKFTRGAQDDVERQARHRVKVRFDGGYRAVCACLWRGERHDAHDAAAREGERHLEEVS